MKRFLFLNILILFIVFPFFSENSDKKETTFGFSYTYSGTLPIQVPVKTNNDKDVVYKDCRSTVSGLGIIVSEDYFVNGLNGYSFFTIGWLPSKSTQYFDGEKITVPNIGGVSCLISANLLFGNPLTTNYILEYKPGIDAMLLVYTTGNGEYGGAFGGFGLNFNIDLKKTINIYIFKFGLIASYNFGMFAMDAPNIPEVGFSDVITAKKLTFTPYITLGFNR